MDKLALATDIAWDIYHYFEQAVLPDDNDPDGLTWLILQHLEKQDNDKKNSIQNNDDILF